MSHTSIRSLVQRSVLSAALVAGVATAQAQDLNQALPTDPALLKGKFANGLTYYVRPNQKPEKKVELRLVVKAGSILEDDDQQGLAHFMEHMNFNGTKNFQKNDLVSYLQSIGVEFGADLNAYTAFDQTVYILPIPTDKEGNLDKGFQIIEDWAHNALLTDKDIDDERGVVLEESRLGKGADDRMLKKYFPRYVAGTKYAQRLPIGLDNILKNFKYETIRRFYRDWYRPNLQAVVVVGDIDTATAMKYLRKHFATMSNPSKERKREYQTVAPRSKQEAMVVTDKEATNSVLQLAFPYQKEKEEKTTGDYRESIKKQLVLQMLNRRLSDLSQSSNPPFPFAQMFFDNMIQGYESFGAYTMFGPEGPAKALNAVTGEILRARKFGFNNSELELAKADLKSNIEKAYNERKTTESSAYVEEYIRNFLTDEPIPGIEKENAYFKEFLPGIQVSELNGLVSEWTKNMNTFTLVTGPEKSEIKYPTDAELLAMTQKGFSQEVKALEEKKVASSLLSAIPQPGTVTSQQAEEGLDATTYTLSNGVKVTIKPTAFKSDEILLTGIKKGGSNNYGVADKNNVKFAAEIVDAMGLGSFSPSDLQKVLAGKKIELSPSIGDIETQVSGSSNVKDFETLLQVTYLQLLQPRKDAALFEAYKTKQKTMLQFISANPQAAFVDTLIRTLYAGNPLAPTAFPKPQDYDQVNLDRVLEIYRNEFGHADGFHFFITGNIKPEEALPLINTYIGSLPVTNTPTAFKDNGLRPINGNNTLKFKKGKEKQSLILSQVYGPTSFSEDLALKAQAVAELLNIKVIEELREKLGAIYGGGFNASVEQYPYEHYQVGVYLPCGPENVDKLLTATDEQIGLLKSKGPEQKDLDKVKTQWKEKHRTNLTENKYWNSKLEAILFWGRSKQNVLQYDSWIDKLTPADVQKTAQQLFDGKNKFTAVLYPES